MHSARLLRLAVPVMTVAALAAACSSSSKSSSSSSSASTPTTPPVSGTINGSGSTLQGNYEDAAIAAFTKLEPGVTINYNQVGSGQGQSDLANKNTSFAGSDVAISATNLPKFNGAKVLYFPIVADPVTVAYNLPSVKTLNLSGPSVAKIFAGGVKYWDDATIAADNPGTKLPHTPVTVVHRSDSSGTTSQFTLFLKKAGGPNWTLGSGTTINWPTSEQAGKGNPGIATILNQTEGAVGYLDFSDESAIANLSAARIKNVAGQFVPPTLAGVSDALAETAPTANLTYDPINAAGAATYPIASPTYILVVPSQLNANQAAVVRAYLTYILGAQGQALASAYQYAPLSQSIDQLATAQLSQI